MSLPYKALLARRRRNLRQALYEREMSGADLALMMQVSRSYVSQLLGPRPCRPITERTRLILERLLKLTSGALDE